MEHGFIIMLEKEIHQVIFKRCSEESIEMAIEPLDCFYKGNSFQLFRPHRVQFFFMLYITEGQGHHIIDFIPYSFRSGNLIFISKGQIHQFEKSPPKGWVVYFTEAFLEKHFQNCDKKIFDCLFNYYLYSPIINDKRDTFFELFDALYKEYSGIKDPLREHILMAMLRLLLLKAERKRSSSTNYQQQSDQYQTFLRFQKMVDTHSSVSRNARDYARMLALSPKSLNNICKCFTSYTPKQFIDKWVVLEMKRLIIGTSLSVNEIAEQMGFDESSNMIKFFKQRTGKTLSQFRKEVYS